MIIHDLPSDRGRISLGTLSLWYSIMSLHWPWLCGYGNLGNPKSSFAVDLHIFSSIYNFSDYSLDFLDKNSQLPPIKTVAIVAMGGDIVQLVWLDDVLGW